MIEPTPQTPRYWKVAHNDGWATQLYFIVCDEGWCQSIVCERMYPWAADWLVETLQGKPFADKYRPGAISKTAQETS